MLPNANLLQEDVLRLKSKGGVAGAGSKHPLVQVHDAGQHNMQTHLILALVMVLLGYLVAKFIL